MCSITNVAPLVDNLLGYFRFSLHLAYDGDNLPALVKHQNIYEVNK
jgi:hypothetical protein